MRMELLSQSALSIVREHPFVRRGHGRFPRLMPRHVAGKKMEAEDVNPHNEYLLSLRSLG